MEKIILTNSERAQLVQLSGSDFAAASLLAALVLSRRTGSEYRNHQALSARQNVGASLECLHRVEIARSRDSGVPKSTDCMYGTIELSDIYSSPDGMDILRDLMRSIQLRDEFLRFYEIHEFEPAIELDVSDLPWLKLDELSALLRGISSLTGINLTIIGMAATF